MADPAPIRGRWPLTVWICENCALGLLTDEEPGNCGCWGGGEPTDYRRVTVTPWPPVPDEAAIERGAKALSQMRYGFMSSETLLNECRAEALAVLRAALEPEA